MPRPDVAQKIKHFITTNFYVADPARLSAQASFYEQGIVDSTGVLEVVSFLEATFGISIRDSEMLPENLDSLHGLNTFVERKLSSLSPLRLLPKEVPPPDSLTALAASASNDTSLAPAILARSDREPE
jgi:acyl carrier protein